MTNEDQRSVSSETGPFDEFDIVAREEANSSGFELSSEAGGDQDSEHQKPQPLNEAAWSDKTLKCRPHPPAPIRFHVACLHLQEYFEQAGDTESRARLAQTMREIWDLGEFLFAETLERTPEPGF